MVNAATLAPARRIGLAAPAREVARLAPVLTLPLLAYILDSSWLFPSSLIIDGWLYYGIADNFAWATKQFSQTYYWTRFAWTLPGALFHQFLDPLTARYWWHFLFFYIGIFSLYGLLRRLACYPVALLGATLLAFDRFFLPALGGDYVDGAVAVYLLLTLYLLTLASTSQSAGGFMLLAGVAGFAFGLAVNVYVAVAPFGLALLLYGAVLRWRAGDRRFWRPALFMAPGFLLTVLLAGAINWQATGSWNYLKPSFQVAGYVLEQDPWRPPPLAERLVGVTSSAVLRWTHWPILIGGLTVANLVLARVRGRELSLLSVGATTYYLSSLVIWLCLEVAGRLTVFWAYMFTLMYPGMYLAAAALLGEHLRWLGRTAGFVTVAAVAVMAGGILLTHRASNFEHVDVPLAVLYLACALGWIAVQFFARVQSKQAAGVSLGLLVGIIALNLVVRAHSAWGSFSTNREDFGVVLEGIAAVKRIFPEGPRLFAYPYPSRADLQWWYLSRNGDAPEYLALRRSSVGGAINAAFFGGFSRLTNQLPHVDCARTKLQTGRQVVIMAPDEEDISRGLESIRGCGFDLQLLARHDIERGPLSYRLRFYTAISDERRSVRPRPEPRDEARAGETVRATVSAEGERGPVALPQLADTIATNSFTAVCVGVEPGAILGA